MATIEVIENISIVTFSNAGFQNGFFTEVLTAVADAGINIDMISQTTPCSDKFSFGFSFSDDDMVSLLTVMNKIAAKHNSVPLVNHGNVKVVIKSNEMVSEAGFAAKVFKAADETNAVVLLVTTGVDEISILITPSSKTDLVKALEKIS